MSTTFLPSEYLAILLLSKHFDAFTKKHYDKLLKQLGVSEEELKDAIELIQKLNPKLDPSPTLA